MTELHTGSLYWETTFENKSYEKPKRKALYDAVIIGGGMSGALCSYVLSKEGCSIALIEQGEVGGGSTSANTGLLQFSNDIMLHELIEKIGEEEAVEFYRSCQKAMTRLQEAADQVPLDVQFHMRESLYYASSENDVPRLKKEYETLKKYGFPVEFWERKDIEAQFPFTKPAAIVTKGDAEVNPLRLCAGAVQFANEKGMDIFEHTRVQGITDSDEFAIVSTPEGDFKTRSVIVTTGYSPAPEKKIKQKDLKVTYAAATKPAADLSSWRERMMIWETERPYLYMRLTDDDRIIAGGLDDDTSKIPGGKTVADRFSELQSEIQKLFPEIDVEFDYEWSAVFGESTDELPVIGRHPDEPNVYYLIGLGGNGTVYSMLGAYLIRDEIKGKNNPNQEVLEIER